MFIMALSKFDLSPELFIFLIFFNFLKFDENGKFILPASVPFQLTRLLNICNETRQPEWNGGKEKSEFCRLSRPCLVAFESLLQVREKSHPIPSLCGQFLARLDSLSLSHIQELEKVLFNWSVSLQSILNP